MLKKYFSFLLYLLVSCFAGIPLFAQTPFTVKGIVKDSLTEMPLASVTVKIDGEYQVALSNKNGVFQLPTRQQKPVAHFSYVGYEEKTMTLDLTEGMNEVFVVLLAPKSVELEEVVTKYVKPKYSKKNNPAVELIEKVIARKNELRAESQPYYQYEKYERTSLALNDFGNNKFKGLNFLHEYSDTSKINDTPILWISVKEKISDVYFRKSPKTEKEIVKGVYRVGIDEAFNQAGVDAILGEIFTDINIFDNDIQYLMTRFVSPLSGMATNFYKYFIVDTIQIDNREYIDLEFVPFNTQNLGFEGHMYIANDSTYSIKRIEMYAPKESQLNYVDNLRIEQEFEQQKNGLWMLSKESMSVELSVIKGINGLYGETNKIYTDFSFEEAPPQIYSLPAATMTSPEAEQYPAFLWEKYRQQGMTAKERNLSGMMDELHQKKAFNLIGIFIDVTTTGYFPLRMKDNKIELGKVGSLASHNRVEGWRFRLGFRTTANLSDHWYFSAYGAYGLKDEKFKYYGDIRYSFNQRRVFIDEFPMNNIGISYKYDLEYNGLFSLLQSQDNILYSLNRGGDDMMSYVKQFSVFYQKEFLNDFSYELRMDRKNEEPAGKLVFLQHVDDRIISIPDITTSTLGIRLRYSPGQKFYQDKGNRIRVSLDAPIFTFQQKVGFKDIFGADYNVHASEFNFLKRFWLSAYGNVTTDISAGKIWNKAPFPLLFTPNANTSYFITNNAFSMLDVMEFINDQYAAMLLTYQANGWILNRIPLVKKLKLREVFSFRSLWGGLTDKNNPMKNSDLFLLPMEADGTPISSKMDNKPYMEATFGLENIFRILRVDYVLRLSYRDKPNIDRHGWQIGFNFVF